MLVSRYVGIRSSLITDGGWAVEEGLRPRIVLYTTTLATRIASLGIWNGHVLVRVEREGKTFWIYGDPPMLHDEPEYPLGKYCWVMDLNEYVDYLKVYKDLSARPYVERKDWPACKS